MNEYTERFILSDGEVLEVSEEIDEGTHVFFTKLGLQESIVRTDRDTTMDDMRDFFDSYSEHTGHGKIVGREQ